MPTSKHSKQILIGNLKKTVMFCARHFFCSQVFKTTSNVFNSDVNIVNIALIAVCSLAVTEFAHWLMWRLRRRNKRYQNPEKAKTNGNCSKLSAASTIRITRAWCHTLCALRLVHCETIDLFSTTSLKSQESYLTNITLNHSRFFTPAQYFRTAL